jgi:Flp pilus assembly pilin Flp
MLLTGESGATTAEYSLIAADVAFGEIVARYATTEHDVRASDSKR